jgi:photosystem II stability/assembly factor-like uncharacterized protein
MKRLILAELLLLFLATTFQSDSPGWVQQTLPVNKFVNDIFFLDSLNGWVVTAGASSGTDTGYVMKTTNGGNNWLIQFQGIIQFNAIQFIDNNTGYTVGSLPPGIIKKTTNGGLNWFTASTFTAYPILDLSFVNKDTGWVCSDDPFDGGVVKTTNGGMNWVQELSASFPTTKLFFLNPDTGWAACQSNKLYRTTNGGTNWNLQATLSQINDIYFFNKNVGIVSSGFSYRTTDGGFNWVQTNDGGIKLSFASDSIGWAGSNFNKIMKTITGGNSWFRQSSPIFDNSSSQAIDTLKAWAGGNGLVHTTDGGGPPLSIHQIGNEIPKDYKLNQNYPNPFNPSTNIKYQITKSKYVTLKIFDITGKEIATLVNQKQEAGTYEVDFSGEGLSSGIYFYTLIVDGNVIDTKKMVLLK